MAKFVISNLVLLISSFLFNPSAFADASCPEEDRATDIKLEGGVIVKIVEHAAIVEKGTWDLCNKKSVGLVNGIIPFGVSDPRPDFAKPYSFLKKLTLFVNNKSYELETTNMYNAWGNRYMDYSAPGAHKADVHLFAQCYDPENCTLRGLFSDAGGAYVAEWQVRSGKALRTILTDSNDIVHHFKDKGIRPPKFE